MKEEILKFEEAYKPFDKARKELDEKVTEKVVTILGSEQTTTDQINELEKLIRELPAEYSRFLLFEDVELLKEKLTCEDFKKVGITFKHDANGGDTKVCKGGLNIAIISYCSSRGREYWYNVDSRSESYNSLWFDDTATTRVGVEQEIYDKFK